MTRGKNSYITDIIMKQKNIRSFNYVFLNFFSCWQTNLFLSNMIFFYSFCYLMNKYNNKETKANENETL